MSKDTKGALIVIGVAVLITVGIFFMTRGRKAKETGGESETEISKQEEVKEEYVDVLADGTRLNNSEKVQKEKTYDGMKFKEIQIRSRDNGTMVVGTITNTSKVTKGGYIVDLKMVDKKGKEIGKAPVYIRQLEPGESMQISTTIQVDVANAYDFNISKRE